MDWRRGLTLLTATTCLGEVHVEIFVTVVVIEFLTRFDAAFCEYIDTFGADINLTVGSTRMIDKACGIFFNISIDHLRVARPKEILARIGFDLRRGRWTTDVLNDASASRNRFDCK